ncbi:hypothetical protein SLS62_006784 [Diatrype stigma]|uniref:Uncharacterized protein n=1 Tax=Diatrype stigma TaxID=117547 RepID=A0AAN9UM60_9PEZI
MVRFLIPAAHAAIEIDTEPLVYSILQYAKSSFEGAIFYLFGEDPIFWSTVAISISFFAVWSVFVGIALVRQYADRAAILYMSQLWQAIQVFLVVAPLAAGAYEPQLIRDAIVAIGIVIAKLGTY